MLRCFAVGKPQKLWYVTYMAGNHMDKKIISGIANKIVEHFRPEKIILFGSVAKGTPTEESDIDILVIMDSGKRPARRSMEVSKVCRPKFVSMDILVRTPEEIKKRLAIGVTLLKRFLKKVKSYMPEKLVKEWLTKAEEDYKTALALNRQRKLRLPNSICFHCQQCIEKYLKAFLVYNVTAPPRTHDLRKLNDVASGFDSSLNNIYDLLEQLNPYSVEFRYPGESAALKEAKEAIQAMKKVRDVLIKKFARMKQYRLWK